jgi:hypothetical protein
VKWIEPGAAPVVEQKFVTSNANASRNEVFIISVFRNDTDQRPRGTPAGYETEALPRGSLHLICWAS